MSLVLIQASKSYVMYSSFLHYTSFTYRIWIRLKFGEGKCNLQYFQQLEFHIDILVSPKRFLENYLLKLKIVGMSSDLRKAALR